MDLAATVSDTRTDDDGSGSDCKHEFTGTDAVYCGSKLRLVSRCSQCCRVSAVLTEVPKERPHRRVCPFCGGRAVIGGRSVYIGVGRSSVGRVCLSCHATIREETDPSITRSIGMVCSEPSEYDFF